MQGWCTPYELGINGWIFCEQIVSCWSGCIEIYYATLEREVYQRGQHMLRNRHHRTCYVLHIQSTFSFVQCVLVLIYFPTCRCSFGLENHEYGTYLYCISRLLHYIMITKVQSAVRICTCPKRQPRNLGDDRCEAHPVGGSWCRKASVHYCGPRSWPRYACIWRCVGIQSPNRWSLLL